MRTVVAQATLKAVTPLVVLLFLYLLVRGHQSPGGGFPAALVAGLLIVVHDYVYGHGTVRRLVRAGAGHLIGWGLLLALGTGMAPLLAGGAFLQVAHWEPRLPVVGTIPLSTALAFEVGVFLTVLGVVVAMVQELGEQP